MEFVNSCEMCETVSICGVIFINFVAVFQSSLMSERENVSKAEMHVLHSSCIALDSIAIIDFTRFDGILMFWCFLFQH